MRATRCTRLTPFEREDGDVGGEDLAIIVLVEIGVADRVQLSPVRVLRVLPTRHLEYVLQQTLP